MDFDFDIMMMNLRTCFYAFLIAYTVFLFWFMLRTTLKLFMKDPVFVQLPLEWWQQQKKIRGKPHRLYSSCRYLQNCLEINLIQHFLLVRFVYSINQNISWLLVILRWWNCSNYLLVRSRDLKWLCLWTMTYNG